MAELRYRLTGFCCGALVARAMVREASRGHQSGLSSISNGLVFDACFRDLWIQLGFNAAFTWLGGIDHDFSLRW
jgi:hypothetical protein